MKLPSWRPPWYGPLNDKLGRYEWLTDALLVFLIAITILLILRGDKLAKTAWLVYLISP